MGEGALDGPAREADPSGSSVPTITALATALGLDPHGAETIRAASRHVVRFPASRVQAVASVPDGAGPRRETIMARLLADAGAPTTRCIAGPITVDGWVVTAWREVTPVEPDGTADAATLGGLAARIHRSTSTLDPRQVLPCDPVGAALQHVAAADRAGATAHDELALLRAEATRLERVWHDALLRISTTAGPPDGPDTGAVIHGDLHAENAVVGEDGAIAIDLEVAGWGPRSYDAAPTVAFVRWYGRPESDLAAFDGAYGAPLTGLARDQQLDEVWALWSTAWAVANRHRSAPAEDEAVTRLATLATGVAPRPWRLR